MPSSRGGSFGPVRRRLGAVADRMRDMRPILAVVATGLVTRIKRGFESSSSPAGEAWAYLSEATLMARARRARGWKTNRAIGPLPQGERRRTARTWTRRVAERVQAVVFNAKPLLDTGRLRRSIMARPLATSIEYGTNLVYAKAQNFGYPENTWGGVPAPIPQRRFMPASSEALTQQDRETVRRWLFTGRR